MNDQEIADAHLAEINKRLSQVGLLDQVQRAVSGLWRANVERHEPGALFDDDGTLGFTASRNVTNRLYAELVGPRGALAADVLAVRDHMSVVFKVERLSVRLIKAPISRQRRPRLRGDFRWGDREGRSEAAERNARHYRMPLSAPRHAPLFDLPAPDAAMRITRCREVFIVWAGDRRTLTAAWIGLPTVAPTTWFATDLIWWDSDDSLAGAASPATPPPSFADSEGPTPKITLKPQRGIASA